MVFRRVAIDRRSWLSAGLALAAAASLAGGCGEDEQPADPPVASTVAPASPDEVVTVEQALNYQDGQQVTVRGALVIEGDRSRLCPVLLESLPPQCGGRLNLEVVGLDRGQVELEEVRGVAWSAGVTLSGTIVDRVLRVRDIAASAPRGDRVVERDSSRAHGRPPVAVERPTEPRRCPQHLGGDEPPQFDARTLPGRREAEARAAAARFGCELRVVQRDGRDFDVTADLRANWIDVEVRDGFVVALPEEGWTSYAPLPRR